MMALKFNRRLGRAGGRYLALEPPESGGMQTRMFHPAAPGKSNAGIEMPRAAGEAARRTALLRDCRVQATHYEAMFDPVLGIEAGALRPSFAT